MPITIAGKTHYVPGVYGTIEIINLGSTNLPAFNNLLLVGSARKGLPAGATGKKAYEFIKPFASINEAKEFYGVSPLTNAFKQNKKGGAGVVFFVNIAALTLAKATIKDNAGVPVNSFDLTPKDEFYGAAGNDIAIAIATADNKTTITFTPPKLHKFLTADASTSLKELSLEDVEGLVLGSTIKLVDNAASAYQSTTITSIDAENNKITIADNPASAFAKDDYARIFVEDTNKAESKVFTADSTINDVIAWINSGNIFKADRKTYAGAIPTELSKVYLGLIDSATKGTSPVATETTGGDFDTFAENAAQYFEEFTNYTKVRLRLLNLLSSSSDVHAVYKTLARDLRDNYDYSIQIITGCALGDDALAESNADHPIQRAKVLNSSDVILASTGLDDEAPYISLSPQFAGMMSANTVRRNFTNDSIDAQKVSKFFGKSNAETVTQNYIQNGCLIVGTGKNGFHIVQGINTYQDQSLLWNSDDKETYLIAYRQTADFVYEGYKNEMEIGVGADGYDPETARQKGILILDKFLADGYITDRKIERAWREGNAVKTRPLAKLFDLTDFIGFELGIIVEN